MPDAEVASPLASIPGADLLTLTKGPTFEEARQADEGLWQGLEEGQLYAFAGTRVLAISIGPPPQNTRVFDMTGHGTEVASIVAREAPESLIVMVQVDSDSCAASTGRCPIIPDVAKAMEWIADQPWIDVVSVSLGWPADLPLSAAQQPQMTAYLRATERAHQNGKLIVNSAGNTPTVSFLDYFNGPPWVIAVGGMVPAAKGDAVESSRFVDVVANFTALVATKDSFDGYAWQSGTSFAAPLVAGTLADSIHRVRESIRAAGELRAPPAPRDYRDAMNATATYPSSSEWNPTRWTSNDTKRELTMVSLPVLVGYAQMGWGAVLGGDSAKIADRVLASDLSPPPEKRDAAAHQARVQGLRESYWG